jgi:PKD domain-containing protein
MRNCLLALALWPSLLAAEPVSELAVGIERVREGDFEGGLLTLDGVARRLVTERGPAKDLAQAYLHLGIAYLGLRQDALANAKLRQALRQDRDLHLSPDEFPPRVIRALEEARRGLAEAAALEKAAKSKRGAGGMLLLGLGGAAAAGIAVTAIHSETPNRPPTAAMTISPEGQAVTFVTKLTFVGTASDPDGNAVTYNWRFGDGISASGQTVTHVYDTDGTFEVTLTVSDGASAVTVDSRVAARTLTGTWRLAEPGYRDTRAFELRQTGAFLAGNAVLGNAVRPNISATSRVMDPRDVTLSHSDAVGLPSPPGGFCRLDIAGQLGPNLDVITAVETCSNCNACRPEQRKSIVMTR